MHCSPEFPPHLEGWVVNHMSKNYWRVQRTQEREDVLQEARLVFLRVHAAYPDVDPPHFTALFKTSWQRRFVDLANEDTERRAEVPLSVISYSPGGEEGEREMEFAGDSDNDGALATLIRQAPAEVQLVVNLFLNAPQEILDLALAGWSDRRDGRFATGGSRRLCRLLGLADDVDVMAMTERHFGR